MELYPAAKLTASDCAAPTHSPVCQYNEHLPATVPLVPLVPPLQRASMAPIPWGSLNPATRWFRCQMRNGLRRTGAKNGEERAACRKNETSGENSVTQHADAHSHLGEKKRAADPAVRLAWPATPRLDGTHTDWQAPGDLRRIILLLLMLAQTAAATFFMHAVLPYQGARWLEVLLLILFAILFCWVSAGFWTAMTGFLVLLRGTDRFSVTRNLNDQQALPKDARAAIVMPIRNEDVIRVFAGLRATFESLKCAGALGHFDFFVLSDSDQADVRAAELAAWARLCKVVDGFGTIFYRHRKRRVKRKSGNIDDFCRRWGKQYRYMIVLDADSVMSGECLANLVRLMEAHAGAGIIQTAPIASGGSSLYARIQQFSHRVYGPLFTAGLHYWQLGESHYWGHNAIIRLAPFMQHCALAALPGRGSLAGEILSHDFVEAALMRRAGWGVWIAYDLPGSYEEMPSSLLEELNRDRRWCHGNLMNFRLFTARGMHRVHRAVFATGVMAYLSAPLWLAFLMVSTALLAQQTLTEPQYFITPRQLFPIWPQWHPEKAIALFSATATLLFLPKLLATGLACLQGAQRFGGVVPLVVGMLIEMLFSMLLAPVRMMFHTRFVAAAFLGWRLHWKSPPRGEAQTGIGQALRRHGADTLMGMLWAGAIYLLNPGFLPWLVPIAGGLMLSVPVSILSSGAMLGRWCRRRRLFLIPEETAQPVELRAARQYVQHAAPLAGFSDLVVDPELTQVALHSGRPLSRSCGTLVDRALCDGPAGLSENQKNALLDHAGELLCLHSALRASPYYLARWHQAANASR